MFLKKTTYGNANGLEQREYSWCSPGLVVYHVQYMDTIRQEDLDGLCHYH